MITLQSKLCSKMSNFENPPWNFSWVVRGELCAMSCPNSEAQLRYLQGTADVTHLVTLSRDHQPPASCVRELQRTLIDVQEFEAPTVKQIQHFIEICEHARENKEVVGVHCRMGRGRTGVMCACYLVKFYDQSPQQAVTNVRLMRPGSVETYSQEKAVTAYHDYIRSY